MAICNDPIQTNLVQVGSLEPQHLQNALSVDVIGRLAYFGPCSIATTETRVDQLLAILVKQIEGIQVRASRDFDEFRKPIADLGFW